MKIYPNKLSVLVKDNINTATDIQLAYVDTTSSVYNINTIVDDKYKNYSKQEVLPYDEVNTSICLFDKYDNKINYEDMIQDFSKDDTGKYVYIPKSNSIKFIPKNFEYYIKAKKKIKYQSNMIYNINTLADYKDLANTLMQIFGDAANRNLGPSNVMINNRDLSLNKITEMDIADSEISFFLLKDFNTMIDKNGKDFTFNKKYYFDEYDTSLFFIVKNDNVIRDYEGASINYSKVNLLLSNVNYKYEIDKGSLYNHAYINTKYYFNIPQDTEYTKYYSLFSNESKTPILIEDNINKGIVVYISEEIINNIKDNYKIIYENILYAYLNGYIRSNILTEWIADEMPDYIVKDNRLIKKNKFTSSLTAAEIFDLKLNEFKDLNVIIDANKYPYVKYDGLYNNYLSFIKYKGVDNIYTDPQVKPDGYISIYTNDEIYFFKNFVYKINDNIEDKVNVQLDDDKVIIDLKSFKHSDSGIYIQMEQKPLEISLIETVNNVEQKILEATYYLIAKNNDSLSYYELVKDTDYKDGLILMTIKISQDSSQTEKTIFDMRRRGGGLPESEEDNFDCFDIGHIYGRPYRKGGSLIITLPKYLEDYKDIVISIVNQYKLADDYPIILFKEE